MLPTKDLELERLFMHAGRAEAARRKQDTQERVARRRELERRERRHRRAQAERHGAARRVWSWLASEDAELLRSLLNASGLNKVALLGWVTHCGRPLPGARLGAWQISLTTTFGELWLNRIGAPFGGRSCGLTTPTEMLDFVPAEIIVALDESLDSGGYERTVRADLHLQARRMV